MIVATARVWARHLRVLSLEALHRRLLKIAARYGRMTAQTWLQTIFDHQRRINLHALQSAVSSGNPAAIEAAVRAHQLQQRLEQAMQDPLRQTAIGGGQMANAVLRQSGIAASFNAISPNVVLYAQSQAALLVTNIPEYVRAGIRTVITLGATGALTVDQQARLIRDMVGLPRHHLLSPVRLGDELRTGDAAVLGRRLSAVDKQIIRSRLAAGTAGDPGFIAQIQERYTRSLLNLRAQTIARTESIAASNWGVNEAWRQAQEQQLLPQAARRFWLVTPDGRLCPICRPIPGLNTEGRAVNEPFETTRGPKMLPPAHPSCRCSIGLMVPRGAARAAAPAGEGGGGVQITPPQPGARRRRDFQLPLLP